MRASWYALALASALKGAKGEKEEKRIFARFREVIRARGHERLLSLVPRELEKIAQREREAQTATLVIADLKSKTKWSHACDHYEREGVLPVGATLVHRVDETIVGGFQIRTKDTLIDGSYKRALLDLYRNITSTAK